MPSFSAEVRSYLKRLRLPVFVVSIVASGTGAAEAVMGIEQRIARDMMSTRAFLSVFIGVSP